MRYFAKPGFAPATGWYEAARENKSPAKGEHPDLQKHLRATLSRCWTRIGLLGNFMPKPLHLLPVYATGLPE